MKRKQVLYSSILIGFLLFNACISQKNKTLHQQELKTMVENRQFKFIAQQITPLRTYINTNSINLGNDYYLAISKDTIDCYLPYFGVSNTAPIDPRKMGIEFTTTEFSYNKSTNKKGGYDIKILPKNTSQASQIYLNISDDGYATLSITQNLRDGISYTGIITSYP